MDVKASLYLCNNSSCSSKTYVTSNDNHDSSLSLPYMGTRNFGIKINLGYETIGYKYMLKVYHWDNSSTGSYTINIEKHNETDKYINDVIDRGVKAVVWESEINPSGNIYEMIPSEFADMNLGDEFLVREIFLIYPSAYLIDEVEDNLIHLKSEIQEVITEKDLIVDVTKTVGGVVVAYYTGGVSQPATKTMTIVWGTSKFSVGVATFLSIDALKTYINLDLANAIANIDRSIANLKGGQIMQYKQNVELTKQSYPTVSYWFTAKPKLQEFFIYNESLVPDFYHNKEVSFTDIYNYTITDTRYAGTFKEYYDENEIADIVNSITN